MTDCTLTKQYLPTCKRRRVELDFNGGDVSSNGGVGLMDLAERCTGLLSSLAKRLPDPRQPGKVRHDMISLLRQRVFAIALGYEDVNDHDALRDDLAFQTACSKDHRLASSCTVGRMERSADRSWAIAAHEALVETFIASFDSPPSELVLDFDATDDAVHGFQQGRSFHGYYDHYCFLPLYVFCGDKLLVSYLRRANVDPAKHAWAVLSLLVKRLREQWPQVRIIFRADSGFCRHKMLNWCDRRGVGYVVGLAKNSRLIAQAEPCMALAQDAYEQSGIKQRMFDAFDYAAKSWTKERRVIARLEHSSWGSNPRFVVTNLSEDPQALYDDLYCKRGDMENRIKEQQLDLFADRTSCHDWWANQFRLLLASLAYTLVEIIRDKGLKATDMARAQVGTIRLKLLKIGAVITRNTRRVCLHLSSSCPDQHTLILAIQQLKPG